MEFATNCSIICMYVLFGLLTSYDINETLRIGGAIGQLTIGCIDILRCNLFSLGQTSLYTFVKSYLPEVILIMIR